AADGIFRAHLACTSELETAMANPAEQEREALNSGTKPVADSHRFDEASLAAWMAAHVADFRGPLEVRQFKGGQSNPTYQLVTPAKTYVMRRKPPGKLLPSAHAVDREYKVISALHPSGFPVARPYGLCVDEDVIGTWFYVMDMVEGRILWDQTLPQYEPTERRALYMGKIRALADLHNVDYAAVGLSDYGKPGNYMGRQVERWARQYKASETARIDEMERLIDWLPRSLPAQERTSIVHGDYRLDNMAFHPTDPKVIAVLDWELGTLGDPLADFTYLLTNWFSGPLADLPDLNAHGIPTLDEAVAAYCGHTGRSGLPDLNWFFAYNLFRSAGIAQGIVGRVRDGTANSPHTAELEAQVPRLAQSAWTFARKAGA
ncbi:MAG TPA: phosphotransferase, partial [Gemmatimonadaceae bacterium]